MLTGLWSGVVNLLVGLRTPGLQRLRRPERAARGFPPFNSRNWSKKVGMSGIIRTRSSIIWADFN